MGIAGGREVEALIRPLVERLGYELWGCEFHASGRHATLRVFIDREEGISLDDCSLVSGQVSALLDVEDPIRISYDLEVSSPGIDRPLLSPEHYERCAGSRVKLRLMAGGKRFGLVGTLLGLTDGMVRIVTDEGEREFPLVDVVGARIVPEWK